MPALPDDLRDAYLQRLGLEAEPPSIEALRRIHRAHVERVPYETLWIQLGEPWTVDPLASAARIAAGRGGYCFHLNGALAALLDALGYDVARHVGGVHGPDGPTAAELSNHLVLTVRDLPLEGFPDGTWYVDVGLGDALHEPLPLLAGTYRDDPFTLRLERIDGDAGDWHLVHDPDGSFTGMAWRSATTTPDLGAFAERHVELSTSPQSGFVRFLTVLRRDATGVDALRGCSLRRIGAGASTATVETEAELVDVLGDLFGLRVGMAPSALWQRVRAAHEAWLASGQP